MNDKVNLAEKFALLEGFYQPGIVGYLNDYKLQIVKVDGKFVWHKHDETDDFFLVISGRLTIHLRDGDVVLRREAATRCEASAEGGRRNLFCGRIGGGRHDVILYGDAVLVWPHARGPDGPPLSYDWRP